MAAQYNDFIDTTSIPGYKFTNTSEAKSQRVFWHFVLIMSTYLLIVISYGFYDQLQHKAILTVLETPEQGIKLPFPAVYLCLGYPLNPERIKQAKGNVFKLENITIPFDELENSLQSAVRFQRSTRNDEQTLKSLFAENIDIDILSKYLPTLYYQVEDFLKNCSVMGKAYPCRKLFKPLLTSPGICFVYNSIYTRKSFIRNPLRVSYKKYSEMDEDWTIRLNVTNIPTSMFIFLKDPRELLSMTDFPNYIWRPKKNIAKYKYIIRNYYAEPEVRKLTQRQRNCIYHDEVFPYEELRQEYETNFYEYGVCHSYCRIMEFYKSCNCFTANALRIMPNIVKRSKICSFEDILCIEKNYSNVRKTKCERCVRACNYTEYFSRPEIRVSGITRPRGKPQNISSTKEFYSLTLDLEYWPLLQFRALIIFSFTEFLVSLMGLAGLFIGTSYLTMYEVFYNIFVRVGFSYVVNWNFLEQKFKGQEEKESSQPPPCIDMSLKLKKHK